MLAGPFGAVVEDGATVFTVFAPDATAVDLCLFDAHDRETRIAMQRDAHGHWSAHVPGIGTGQRYGYRADGAYDPAHGHWFDPSKLLADPFATRIDRPFAWHAALAAARGHGFDTAPLVPKSVVETAPPARAAQPRLFAEGGLIYELNVRAFTMLHPDVPHEQRGTLAALAHPAVIGHLKALGVDAVELMPITAWIDERHLPPLGLTNAWGYNPVTLMALDPRLAPGGIADLAKATAALRAEGIGVILDLVFNHTGESDRLGPTLSLRGLCNLQAFRHDADHQLINDTGTGNTLDCQHPFMVQLITDALTHFVLAGGVDGFRFDLGTVLGRTADGFSPEAPLIRAILQNPVLKDRVLIAEPWDIGPGGYRLGQFPDAFFEWNDRYRDTIRRFWRGDGHLLGPLATALAGSSDLFAGARTRSVNFIAAHDGFTLADLVSHAHKHNEANGENNRDGHNDNHSWNHGVEGETGDATVFSARNRDLRALLTLLFASRGTIMLTAGDESGRSQRGNNNAYCQDNELGWFDWDKRDGDLEVLSARLAEIRRDWPHLTRTEFLSGDEVEWLTPQGHALTAADWETEKGRCLAMVLLHPDDATGARLAVLINRGDEDIVFALPQRAGFAWRDLIADGPLEANVPCPARTVMMVGEHGQTS